MTTSDERDPAPNLPEVDGGACVHSAAVLASCRACIEACPRRAWILSDDGLGLDTTSCDGCGLCLPACPTSAITLPRPPQPLRALDRSETLLAACEVAATAPGKGVVPCLEAFGLDDLAHHYAGGIRRLVITRGDCASCSRGPGGRLDTAAADLSRLLADRGLAPLTLEQVAASAWSSRRDEHLTPSRRSLFAAFRSPADTSTSPAVAADAPAALSLPAGRGGRLVPFQPVIDGAACIACDACARICPTQALAIESRGTDAAAYAVTAARCTGCRLCIDVCDAGAVKLMIWTETESDDVVLDAAQCSACGNLYRVIAGRRSEPPLCRICAKTRHTRNLFQVMK